MKVDNLIIKWMYGLDFATPSNISTDSTSCVVMIAESEKVIGEGITWRSNKDSYCKETGRRIALQRALLNSNLEKSQRAKVWETYRTLTKVPRWEIKNTARRDQ